MASTDAAAFMVLPDHVGWAVAGVEARALMAVPDEASRAVNGNWLAFAVGDVKPFAVVAAVSDHIKWADANTGVFNGRCSL